MIPSEKTKPIQFLYLFYIIFASEKVIANQIIHTSYGPIQGTTTETIQEPNLNYLAFKGIPYAKPPLGKLRFQPPQKPEPRTTLKTCTTYASPCLQISNENGTVLGSEDCLTLNVFTKNISTSKSVMFWIHGGAHIRGYSAEYPPDYLVVKDIVLVTVNFRLNIFGFFTLHDKNACGNNAFKDHIAALEWVQENIANFGGDPSKVTIFGESSGSNSVGLLQLSTRAKGLFHQIIGESGSVLNPRYLQRDPLKYAYNIARYFNISTETTQDILEGLQKIDSKVLAKAANSSEATGYKTNLKANAFYPVIEAETCDGAIITKSPFELLETGNFQKIPFILGYNTGEGSLGLKIVKNEMNVAEFNTNYTLFSTESLNNKNHNEEIGEVVRSFFLGNSSVEESIDQFTEFLGEELLIRGIIKTLIFLNKYSKGYCYKFSYKGTHTTDLPGVGHAEELQYLFPISGKTANQTQNDITTRNRMVEMWTNFAIYGAPTPKQNELLGTVAWVKCGQELNFLNIGTSLTTEKKPDNKNYKFWKNLFASYGRLPFLTY